MSEGTLYIVATPIGNLGDMTLRALETLKKVDLIACEDTRNTLHLLTHFGISKRLVACHDHNEEARSTEIANLVRSGQNVALVSDSGMPLVSDPGYRIVRKITAEGLKLDVIPGPTAFVAGLVLSGMPVDKFVFLGFLPQKQSKKIRYMEEIRDFSGTVILYESPYKLMKTLDFLKKNVETDRVSVVKEITKLHQKTVSGTMDEVILKLGLDKIRGEYVIYFTLKFKNS